VDRYRNGRECNRDALFEHVLTMTGESIDINEPQFEYDATGDACFGHNFRFHY